MYDESEERGVGGRGVIGHRRGGVASVDRIQKHIADPRTDMLLRKTPTS